MVEAGSVGMACKCSRPLGDIQRRHRHRAGQTRRRLESVVHCHLTSLTSMPKADSQQTPSDRDSEL